MVWKLSLIAIAVAFIGSGLGVTAYAWQAGTLQQVGAAVAANSARPIAPKTVAVDRVGSEYRLAAPAGSPYNLLFVNHTGLWLWTEAYKERDQRGEDYAMRNYETLKIPNGTRVRVVDRQGDTFQLEIVDGPLQGRRGWTDYAKALPDAAATEPAP